MSSRPVLAALLLLLLVPSWAGAAATSGETSVIKNNDIQFGRFASLGSKGTVTVSATGAISSTGGIRTLSGGTVAPAAFTVTGAKNAAYNIHLPAPNTVLLTFGGRPMTVTGVTCSVPLSGKLGPGKTSMPFTVGMTLSVPNRPMPGCYSGTFNVSVD